MGKFVTNVRPMPTPKYGGEQRIYSGGVLMDVSKVGYPAVPTCQQETRSWRTGQGERTDDDQLAEDRRIFRNGFTSNDPVYDRGHPFLTTKTEFSLSHRNVKMDYAEPGVRIEWNGPISVWPQSGYQFTPPPIPELTSSEIADYGHRAMLNTAPTRPQASVAQLLGETALEGLPSIIGSGLLELAGKAARKERGSLARTAGGEYLNVQFGWVPLLSDLRKSVSSLMRANQTIRQLQRDSGKVVRRRFSFPEQTSVTTSTYTVSGNFPVNGSTAQFWEYQYPDAMSVTVDRRTSRKIWFSGAYSYFVPSSDSLIGKLEAFEQRANVLLGTRVTPEVLWELAPWSWLADWRATIGDSIAIATTTSSDNLVLRYGYLMCHTVTEDLYTPTVPFRARNGWRVSPAARVRRETKQRVQSTPYGFGLKLDDFSIKQWSILAALGMTKAPNTLR